MMGTSCQGHIIKLAWEMVCGLETNLPVKVNFIKKITSKLSGLEIVCKSMDNFEHGKLWIISEIYNEEKLNISLINIGDTINFECDDGFDMDGLSLLECLEDGVLSDLPPICQPVPCSTPPM
jgi:hypothetical protein